jgi:hypothetical protein
MEAAKMCDDPQIRGMVKELRRTAAFFREEAACIEAEIKRRKGGRRYLVMSRLRQTISRISSFIGRKWR